MLWWSLSDVDKVWRSNVQAWAASYFKDLSDISCIPLKKTIGNYIVEAKLPTELEVVTDWTVEPENVVATG